MSKRRTLLLAIATLLSGGAQATSANDNAASRYPMSPDEIRALRHQFDEVEKAKQRPAPKADVRRRTIHTIDLTAGPTEELATVAMGYATTVIAVGENGKPWPIQTVIPGNSAALEATLLTEKAATSAVLHAKHPWVSSNITLGLTSKAEPVVLFVRTVGDPAEGQDSIIRVRVPGNPPGTQPLPVPNVGVVDDALANTLVWSPGASWIPVKLTSKHLPFRVNLWTSPDHKRYILRMTNGAKLHSPSWVAQERSSDGQINVFEFAEKPILLVAVAQYGTLHHLSTENPVATLAAPKPLKHNTVSASRAVGDLARIQRQQASLPSVTHAPLRTKPWDSYEANGLSLIGKRHTVSRKASRTDRINDTHDNKAWRVIAKRTLRETIGQWCRAEGWHLNWKAEFDFIMNANKIFRGSLAQALRDIQVAAQQANLPLRFTISPESTRVTVSPVPKEKES